MRERSEFIRARALKPRASGQWPRERGSLGGSASGTADFSLPPKNRCSSPIVADGKIILPLGPAGNPRDTFQVEMLKPSPEKYIGAGMFNPEAAECASPAVAGGKLYLRLYDGVACYDLRAGAR